MPLPAEGISYSAEKKSMPGIKSTQNSPQVTPSKPTCARSLLLEPDMEDLISILPGTADFKNLDQSLEEEEHVSGEALTNQADTLL